MVFWSLISFVLIGAGHFMLFYFLLGHERVSPFFVMFMTILFTLFLTTCLALTQMPELNVVLLFSLLVVLGLLHRKRSLHETIYFALLSIVLFTVVKNSLYVILFELHMVSSLPYYTWTPSALHFCMLILLLGAMFMLRNFIRMTGRYIVQSRFYKPSYVVLVVCTLLMLVINYPKISVLANLHATYGQQLYMVVLLVVILLLSIFIIFTYISKERFIEQHEERERLQLMEYVEKLEFLHDELATFRHDYTNVLLSLEHAIHTNDMEQVRTIYSETIAPTATIINLQQLELTKLARVTQVELKSLLSVKVLAAQRRGLNVQLDIPQQVPSYELPTNELLRVTSVLIDNAIEEAEQSPHKQLQLALFTMDDSQYFIVQNTVSETAVELPTLFDKHHSSKGEQRGLGLFSVQRLIEKYPHVTLSTKLSSHVFAQELLIKAEPFMKR